MDLKDIGDHYKENKLKFLKIINHKVNDSVLSEDILQESYCRAIKYLNMFNEDNSDFDKWFSKIVLNLIRKIKNKEKSRGIIKDIDDLTEELFISTEENNLYTKIIVDKIINKTKNSNQILYLNFVLGFSPSEISKVLNINLFLIKKVIQRYKKLLRQKYDI